MQKNRHPQKECELVNGILQDHCLSPTYISIIVLDYSEAAPSCFWIS